MKNNFLILTLFSVFIISGLSLNAQDLKFYKKNWAKVDSFENKGLPKSALQTVDKIYEKAKAENYSEQVIKSFIFKLKYKNQIEENAFEKLCLQLDSAAQKASLPDNAIMHSMLADMYWWYYQNNRWKFMNRSNTVNFDNNDMQTWTLDYLTSKVIDEYKTALSNSSELQKISVDKYPELIVKGTKPANLRPTLYDFIANKAIKFFSNTEISLTKPQDYYQIKEDFYLSDINTFVKSDIKSSDTLSLHYNAMQIMQDLLKFRLTKNSEKDALIDADLTRLRLAYRHSVNPLKDKLYFDQLKELKIKYKDIDFVSEVYFAIAQYYEKMSSKYNPNERATHKYKFYHKNAYEICNTIIEKYPKTNVAKRAKALISKIETHSLSFQAENIISSKTKFASLITYKNTDKIYIKITKIDYKQYEKYSDKLYSYELYDKLISNSKAVYTKEQMLPEDKDYNSHSVEILLPELDKGFYIIFISDNKKFTYNKAMTSYRSLWVSNISFIKQSQENGKMKYLVLDRKSGAPLQGVTLKTWYSKYNYALRKYTKVNGPKAITDNNGMCIIDKKNNDYQSYNVDLFYNEDSLIGASNFYLGYYNEHKVSTTINTHFFTDRSIYRLGQTIYFKGIVIKTKGDQNEIQTSYKTNVILYDVNRQKVSEQTLTTNEFGTFSGTFNIPLGLINGNFTIATGNNTISFSVEEYKRPKFSVEMLPYKSNYRVNDNVTAEGKAMSYSGANLSDVEVKYHITRTPKWFGWRYWYYKPQTVEIANGTLKTDETGKFKIDFKANPDLSITESEFTYFSYNIKIDVTDLNGETQSTSSSINVGYRALKISLPIENSINKNDKKFDSNKTSEYQISTLNLNNEFVTASGEIKIYKLKNNPTLLRSRLWQQPEKFIYTKEEWNKLFPENVYKNENDIKNLEKEKEVFSQKFDTKVNKKINMSFLKNYATGQYVVEIKSTDAFGNSVSNKHFFSIYSDKGKKIPFISTNFIKDVNKYCEPGETAKFIVGSSSKNVKLLYEIEHKGKIISSEFISLNNEQKIIEIPIKEEYRGNISVHFAFIKNNRLYNENYTINVPYSNKKLDIEFESFRDKLYPGQDEEWKLKVKGAKGEKVIAEMLAELYDASLDQFRSHNWFFSIYNSYYNQRNWSSETFTSSNSSLLKKDFDKYNYPPALHYNHFNWFNFRYYSYKRLYYATEKVSYAEVTVTANDRRKNNYRKSKKDVDKVAEAPMMNGEISEEYDETILTDSITTGKEIKESAPDLKDVKLRTNFNETAFFYPNLQTDEEGNIIIKFTVPESLTKWKMLGFATTKDLKFGFIENELVTQKDLMVVPNEPRFFRENDKITFPVKISNISKEDISGDIKLELLDAFTMKPIKGILIKGEKEIKKFTVKAGLNSIEYWDLQIPENVSAIVYKVIAKSDKFSDGEQKAIPVLTNRMLVTESLPLPVRGSGTSNFTFKKLINSGKSSSIKNHKLTLEFTSNPAWYAVQALPYLMEYPYECTEQTFSRFYANSIASHIANSNPKIKMVFDSWKNTDSKELISNLEKNQELKAVLLEETPWVMQGKNETQRKKRVGLLFDLNRMGNEMGVALKKIQKAQTSNGAWPWFPGMKESRYITQHIVTGMGHLDKLGIKSVRDDAKTFNMLKKAIGYLDIRIKEDYRYLKKHYNEKELKKNHLSYTTIQYLYGRSYFKDIPIPNPSKEAFDYYKGQSEKYWLSQSKYMQGMIALALFRYENKTVPADIVKSLKENSTTNAEMGMYWKDNVGGWYWYQAPIEQQALMIEVFDEVANDQASVNDLKVWLLKQKQTQDWKTTKATTEAVYALLMRGDDWLANAEIAKITLGGKLIDPKKLDNVKVEAGTGYFKTSWSGSDIKPNMGNVTVSKTNDGVAWGALYWQYFEDLDKITPHETPLKLKKQLFVERMTSAGKVIEPINKTEIKIGDKIIVRIELRVDRAMEYIHMKDMRASGFEPVNVISRYKYQDGLGYYESTKDASTNFFMDYLPKGTYVFEYPLKITHKGDFSNGITSIQCMYAPEFTAHSEGVRVKVDTNK